MKVSLIFYLLKLNVLMLLIYFSNAQFWSEINYFNETGIDHFFSCSANKKCVKLHNCPDLLDLMQQQALPVSR